MSVDDHGFGDLLAGRVGTTGDGDGPHLQHRGQQQSRMAADKVKEMKPGVEDAKVGMDTSPIPGTSQLCFSNG